MPQRQDNTATAPIEEMVAPGRTALVIIDMQNDLCSPDGITARSGADLSMIHTMMPKLIRLRTAARRAGVLVTYLKLTDDPQANFSSPALVHFRAGRKFLKGVTEMLMENTWGWEIPPELSPLPDEPVLLKYRPDGFAGTMLDSVLRSNDIQTVVVSGVATHGCVEATARGAACRDYTVVVPSDCVANREPELHEASLTVMSALYHAVPGDDLVAAWEASAASDASGRALSQARS